MEVGAFNMPWKITGPILFTHSRSEGHLSMSLWQKIDEEVGKLQNELISERDYEKLQNKFESQFVNANSSIEGIANSLARYYMLYGDTKLINEEIDIYRSVTREDIREVARKYLNPNQRLLLEYVPEESENN